MMQKISSIRIANSDIDKVRFQKLLYDTYITRLAWLDAKNYTQNRVTDRYDDTSDIIMIFEDANLIGGSRITKLSTGSLPHEDIINSSLSLLRHKDRDLYDEITSQPRHKIAEINRMIAVGKTHLFVLTQAKSMLWYASQDPVEVLYAVIDVQLFMLCDRIDFPLIPIGIPEQCEGSWTIPTVILRRDLFRTNAKRLKSWQSQDISAIVGIS